MGYSYGDVCDAGQDGAFGLSGLEINRCNTANNAGTCKTRDDINIIENDQSNWYCDCSEEYYGAYCENDRCSIVKSAQGSASTHNGGSFYGAPYKVCNGILNKDFVGSCYLLNFYSEAEALAWCAENSANEWGCVGAIYSKGFGSRYSYMPVHKSPADFPEEFAPDAASYFFSRDCSVLAEAPAPVEDSADAGSDVVVGDGAADDEADKVDDHDHDHDGDGEQDHDHDDHDDKDEADDDKDDADLDFDPKDVKITLAIKLLNYQNQIEI